MNSSASHGFVEVWFRTGAALGETMSIIGQIPTAQTKPENAHHPPWIIPATVMIGRTKPSRCGFQDSTLSSIVCGHTTPTYALV